MAAHLNVEEVTASGASPARWITVLHGIFGTGRNWASVARGIAGARPEWGLLLVDLRQHGGSTGFKPPHTLARAAADLDAVTGTRTVPVVMGHSLGGKVALIRARDDHGVEQAWIVDSTPEVREAGVGPWSLLKMIRGMPDEFPDRQAAAGMLMDRGIELGIARWMATNLERRGDAFRWRLDLDDMEALLLDFCRTDLWSVVEDPRPGLVLHFIRATGSAVLSAEAIGRIRAAGEHSGRVFLHDVRGNHWLNADNPDALVKLVAAGL
jgi:esterase